MTPDSIYSLLHLDIMLLKDSLGSVQAELARSMASCKVESEKVSDAVARLEILTALVKTSSISSSDMDCGLIAKTSNKNDDFATVVEPTASTLIDLNVGNHNNNSSFEKVNIESDSKSIPEEEQSPSQYASCKNKIRDGKSDTILGVNESVEGVNTDKAATNTVDDLSTIRPKIAKKCRAESKKKIAVSAKENGPNPPAMTSASYEAKEVDVKDCSDLVCVNDNVVKSMTLTRLFDIIGPGGWKISKITRESGASIDVLGNRFDKERKVLIKGRSDQVNRAFEMIQDLLHLKIMNISSVKICAIIGEKGSVLNNLRRTTGASIFIDPAERGRVRSVAIAGSTDQVREASEMIQKLLREWAPSVFRV